LAFFSFGTNALLNWWLIPIYGIIGAAFASFIGLFLYSIVMQILSFRYMNKKYIIFTSIGYIGIFIFVLTVFSLGDL
jgi:O-antigen/teichoic acid export membrane protein